MKADQEDDDDDEEKEVPGAYNPAMYAGLNVSQDVKEVFEYINRYKPQKIDLETKIKPFIPDYIPAVGDIDAFIKVSRSGQMASLPLKSNKKIDLTAF